MEHLVSLTSACYIDVYDVFETVANMEISREL